MNIQAVFFDMGGTIDTHYHDRATGLQAAASIRQLLACAGCDLSQWDDDTLYAAIKAGQTRYRLWREDTLIELPPERIWREFVLRDVPLAPHQLDEVAEELAITLETQYFQRQMRPEMPETLQALQQMGLKLGVISNVQSRGQVPGDLQQYGLLEYFDPIVMSSVYGRRKPDPAIFHHAASLAHVPTSACVYVGDRISRDILGARLAGYGLAFLIRHDYKEGGDPPEPVPDAILTDMGELLEHLKTAQQRDTPTRNTQAIKAILFDASDVLYFRPRKGEKLQAFLNELGLAPPLSFSADKQVLQTRAFQREIDSDAYYTELLKLYGVEDEAQIARGKTVLTQESNDIEVFDGVPETLARLKAEGFLLGIVTDTILPISQKLRWFREHGFGHVWDAMISSCDVGIRKPQPGIYQAALQQLGVAPHAAAFVGHHPAEIQGANEVGLTTIGFNYEEGVQADYYVEHFADLPDVPIFSVPRK